MTAHEVTVEISGKSYTFSRFTNDLRTEYLGWAKDQLPDPFEGLAELLPTLPKDYADELFEEAKERRRARGSLNDPDLLAFQKTPESVLKILSLCLRKHHGDLNQLDVIELCNNLFAEHGETAFENLFPQVAGKVPVKEEAVENSYFPRTRADAVYK